MTSDPNKSPLVNNAASKTQNELDLDNRPAFTYEIESDSDKLTRKAKESPLMLIGLTGCAGVLAYGIYRYKRRGRHMSTSNFLMQLRVTAQAAVIGSLTVGVAYHLINKVFFGKSDSEE